MSKTIVPGILRLVSMLFKYLKNGISKKLWQVFLRFVNILFLIFEKGYEQKIVLGFFKIL